MSLKPQLVTIIGISNRHSRLVEDTTALEIMYVEGNSGKITRNFGKWRATCTCQVDECSGTEFEGTYCLIKTQTLIRFLLINGSGCLPGARKLKGFFVIF